MENPLVGHRLDDRTRFICAGKSRKANHWGEIRCSVAWRAVSHRSEHLWALTYSSHLWTVVGDALTIMRHSFYNDVEALLRRY